MAVRRLNGAFCNATKQPRSFKHAPLILSSKKQIEAISQSSQSLAFVHSIAAESLAHALDDSIWHSFIQSTSNVYQHISHLSLQNCIQLTDLSLHLIAAEPPIASRLKSLNVAGCVRLTDAAFIRSSNFHSLSSLIADDCQITDKGVAFITGFASLTDVSFASCPGITYLSFFLLRFLAELKTLNMSFCHTVSRCVQQVDHSILALTHSISWQQAMTLVRLAFAPKRSSSDSNQKDAGEATDSSEVLIEDSSFIEQLPIRSAIRSLLQVSSFSLYHFDQPLELLNLAGCTSIQSRCLRTLAPLGLRTLILRGCALIGDESLIEYCESKVAVDCLRELDISDCVLMSDRGLLRWPNVPR